MAWEIGPFSVRLGASVQIAFWWDRDPGVQAIQVLPRWSESGDVVVGATANLELTSLSIENQPMFGRGPSGDRIVYFVTVTHLGATGGGDVTLTADPTEFLIRGGKV